MKNKITRFILMVAFVISAVYCKVDATDQNHFPVVFHSEPPDLDVPAIEEPLPVVPEVHHTYTDEEVQQVDESLVGIYQGITANNEVATLDIGFDASIYMTINGVETFFISNTYYNMGGETEAMLMLSTTEEDDYYAIRFQAGSHTEVIGLTALTIGCPVLYFRKLEDNEIPPHDEL